ncbi:MAG: type II secretion system protein GspE, partial [Bacteroidetes bacterium]
MATVMPPEQAVTGPPAKPDRGRLLPFTFAKRHGLLVTAYEDGRALTLVREDASPAAVAEVRRYTGTPLQLEVVGREEFDERLQQTYERESNNAMQMVEGLGEDDDLLRVAQELPEPSDLL